MKRILLPITGVMFGVVTLDSAISDTAAPLQTTQSTELRAAITDMPHIIDMSHADPKTWHTLPSADAVYPQSPAYVPASEELQRVNTAHLSP